MLANGCARGWIALVAPRSFEEMCAEERHIRDLEDAPQLTRLDKLRIASYAAPHVRNANARPIKVVDKDGKVLREINSRELAEKIHARAGIEFEVQLDAKPIGRRCSACGRPFLSSDGRTKRCVDCRVPTKPKSERKTRLPHEPLKQAVCVGFDGPCPEQTATPRIAFQAARVKARNGEPWRCRVCAGRKQTADPASRERLSRAGSAGWTTADQRSEHSRKIHAAQTSEQRSERQRKASATRRGSGT